jgi:hypothetical protein
MSLFARLLQAVGSWRRRRGSLRTVRNAGIAMEQLDHRQMLSVTFTGNVAADFPVTQNPGVVVLPDNANVSHPVIGNEQLAALVKVSGFDINGLRVSYSPDHNGTLSVGIEQPLSQNLPGPVIASDADNNGNSGSVNPAVTALGLGVQDPATFGGTEYMGIYLDFLGTGLAQIVAGFPQIPPAGGAAKVFQVATANQAGPNVAPTFVTQLPQFQGNIYTQNDPAHPNMELSIVNFDQLFKDITGQDIQPTSVFNVGAFAGSSVDGPISEAFFPAQPVLLSAATPPVTPPVVCPPISPPILINPHEHRIIDNTHRDLVRVYIQGTSGFDPATIDPATVDFAGAKPVAVLPHRFPRSPFVGRTFVFNAKDIQANPGLQTLTFTAKTFDGQDVETSNQVVNVPYAAQRATGRLSFLMNRDSKTTTQYVALHRLARTDPNAILDPSALAGRARASAASVSVGVASPSVAANVAVNYTPQASARGTVTPVASPREVVTLSTAKDSSRLSPRLHRTLEDFLGDAAVSTPAGATAGGAL